VGWRSPRIYPFLNCSGILRTVQPLGSFLFFFLLERSGPRETIETLAYYFLTSKTEEKKADPPKGFGESLKNINFRSPQGFLGFLW